MGIIWGGVLCECEKGKVVDERVEEIGGSGWFWGVCDVGDLVGGDGGVEIGVRKVKGRGRVREWDGKVRVGVVGVRGLSRLCFWELEIYWCRL